MTALRLLTEKALDAFWQTIVEQFPEAISGDLSPGATITLSIAAEEAVDEWIENNVTTQDCDITVGYRFRLFRLDGQDTEHPEHSELTGVVTAVDEQGVWGRMDQPIAGSNPCDTCIHWTTRYEFCRGTIPL
jgi:hypothetical protein